ncbi:hypothetical protein ACQ3G6_00940 [Allorhizobium undicola]|uniref:hypothetical protein n=1 Tax=Allorhizobium undicola TaxID=78527 RepID=UPI003D33507A
MDALLRYGSEEPQIVRLSAKRKRICASRPASGPLPLQTESRQRPFRAVAAFLLDRASLSRPCHGPLWTLLKTGNAGSVPNAKAAKNRHFCRPLHRQCLQAGQKNADMNCND